MTQTAEWAYLISAFCPQCGRYVGLGRTCSCGWQVPGLAVSAGQPLWQVGTPGPVLGRPAVGEVDENPVAVTPWLRLDRQFAPEAGGLLAVNLEDGSVHWRWPAEGEGSPPGDAVAIGAGMAIFGTGDGLLHALCLDSGDPAWEVPLGGTLHGAPLLHLRGECLFAATLSGSLHEVDLADGRVRRLVVRGAAGFTAGPFLVRGQLVCVDERGEVWGIETESGRVHWHFQDPEGIRGRARLAAGRDRVYLATEAGRVYALCPGRERPVWSAGLPAPASAPPTVGKDLLLVPSRDGRFTALRLSDGREQWHFQMGKRATGPVAVWQGLAFVGSHDERVYCVDMATGKLVWKLPVGGRAVGGVVVHRGVVLAGTMILDAERQVKGGQVVAVPWHLGRWACAATFAEKAGALDAAAVFRALSGEPEEAARMWSRSGRPELAGRLWESLGRDREAAVCHEEAGERWRVQNAARATRYYQAASECYERDGNDEKAAECFRLARRLGGLPDLRIVPFNVPELRQGEPGRLSVCLINDGVVEATEITLRLGGGLAELVQLPPFEEPLAPGQEWLLTFEVVAASEESRMLVDARYRASKKKGKWYTRCEIPIRAAPRPTPLIEVGRDVGLLKVSLADVQGMSGPSVRVGRDGGMIGIEGNAPPRRAAEEQNGD